MTDNAQHSADYRPDVDGLRAVSVVGVILFHAGLGLPGGYVGVDVFFVISGFLITRIIQSAIQQQRFTLTGFWARRVRRILPASLAITSVTLLAGGVVLLPYDFHELGEAALGHGLFASNVYHWLQLKDYFAREAELRPLLHTWSLAVEEQFYFVYPFLLQALRNSSRQQRLGVLAALSLGSFALSSYSLRAFPEAGFFLLPTRAWELLAGGLIALWGKTSCGGPVGSHTMSCSGLGLILTAMLCYDSDTGFPGLAACVPVLGTVLVILGNGTPDNWVRRGLSFRPVVFLGLISYSLYLWHWPLLALAKYIAGSTLPGVFLTGVLGTAVILSVLSWRYIELPFRDQRSEWKPFRVMAVGFSSLSLVCIVAAGVVLSGGVPARYAGDKLATEDAGFASSAYFRGDAEAVPAGLPVIGCGDVECGSNRLVLWGDSHATPVVDALDLVLKEAGIQALVAARSASAPIIDFGGADSDASRWNNAVQRYLEMGHASAVLVVSRWSTWLTEDAAYKSVAERLHRLTQSGVQVYLMLQVPEQSFHVCRAIHGSRFGATVPPGCNLAEHQGRQGPANAYLKKLASDNVRLIDPSPCFFTEAGAGIVGAEGRAFYRDDDHLSSYGALQLLTPLLRNMAVAIRQKRDASSWR